MTNESDSDMFVNITFLQIALNSTDTAFPAQAQFKLNFWLKSPKPLMNTVQTCKKRIVATLWSLELHHAHTF